MECLFADEMFRKECGDNFSLSDQRCSADSFLICCVCRP